MLSRWLVCPFISVVFMIEIGIVNITLLYMFLALALADVEADMLVNNIETSSDLSGLINTCYQVPLATY